MTPSSEVKRAATMAERERIIKLLHWESRSEKTAEMLYSLEKGELRHEIFIQHVIALIKGENK
jgi:hypothetical protein